MRTRLSAPTRLEGLAASSAPASRRWAPTRSYGVTAIAFASGHALRLRVIRASTTELLRTVWHRPPGGGWVAYVDGSVDGAPDDRGYGQAPTGGEATPVCLSWPGPRSLTVGVDAPRLRWSLRFEGSPLTRLVNRLLPRLSAETYRRQPALALVRSVAEEALGPGPGDPGSAGAGESQGTGPPQRLFLVHEARAEIDGVDLGRSLGFEPGTDPGPLRWPALGAIVEGEVHEFLSTSGSPWISTERELSGPLSPPGPAQPGNARPGR